MRCPVCKAENLQGPTCRRCKADLSLLWALEEQRRIALAEARRCLRRGHWAEALQEAETADWLRGDDESRRLRVAAQLMRGDFAAAWQGYQNRRAMPRGE